MSPVFSPWKGMLWGTHQMLIFSQVMRSDDLQLDLTMSSLAFLTSFFLWILHLFFWGSLYSLEFTRGTEEKKGNFEDHPLFFTMSTQFFSWSYQKGIWYKEADTWIFCRVWLSFFVLISVIVVISFSVSKLLKCREFKQLVKVRDSRGTLKVLFPFAYITCTWAWW